MIWVKICGTTSLRDANISIAAGVDALGFIFAPSSRQIGIAKAVEIAAAIGNQVETIGVFVNQKPQVIAEIAEKAGLTGVQLHGDEPAEQMAEFRQILGSSRKIIKTLHPESLSNAVDSEYRVEGFLRAARTVDAILLDSGSAAQQGGTGTPFSWREAMPVAKSIQSVMPVIIAGGLTPENVQDAIRYFTPWGVDVASGVEAQPGIKDEGKLQGFVAAVRAAGDRVHAR
jgi:phosphoribosylanthranilate isomerase